MRRIAVLFLSCVAVLFGLFLLGFFKSEPPKETNLIENFYAHRAAYERQGSLTSARCMEANSSVIRISMFHGHHGSNRSGPSCLLQWLGAPWCAFENSEMCVIRLHVKF